MKNGISEHRIRNMCAKLTKIKNVTHESKGKTEKLNITNGNDLYNYLRDNKFLELVTEDIRVGKAMLSKDEVRIIMQYKVKDDQQVETDHKFIIEIHLIEALTA